MTRNIFLMPIFQCLIPPPLPPVPKIIEMLCKLIITTEKNLFIEPGSILRKPLIGYLNKYPSETMDFFTNEGFAAKDPHFCRFAVFILDQDNESGALFRDALKTKVDKLIPMLKGGSYQLVQVGGIQQPLTQNDRNEIQFVAVNFIHVLIENDRRERERKDKEQPQPQAGDAKPAAAPAAPSWIAGQGDLINAVKKLWNTDAYHERHRKGDAVDYTHWREPRVLVQILLEYFKENKDTEILLLFQLLRALCGRFVADFQFLKDFLEKEICQKYPVEWKRAAFFEFVRLWNLQDSTLSQELKGRILQYIIIPCFAYSFDHGEGDALIGSPPAPDQGRKEGHTSRRVIDQCST